MFKWLSGKKPTPKTILVADDEDNIVRTIADRLEMTGYNVVTASDGEEALEKALSQKPDLILLDIIMPRLDGHGTLEKLRQMDATRHIPVIMLTAQSQADDVHRANNAGANGYFVKPFDLVELLHKIEQVLAAGVQG